MGKKAYIIITVALLVILTGSLIYFASIRSKEIATYVPPGPIARFTTNDPGTPAVPQFQVSGKIDDAVSAILGDTQSDEPSVIENQALIDEDNQALDQFDQTAGQF